MEKQANQKLKQASKVIESINGLNGQHQAIMDEFRELQQYYDESLQFNAEADSMSKGKPMDDDPYDAGKQAMDNMDGMFDLWGTCLAVSGMNCFKMNTPFIIISILILGN